MYKLIYHFQKVAVCGHTSDGTSRTKKTEMHNFWTYAWMPKTEGKNCNYSCTAL